MSKRGPRGQYRKRQKTRIPPGTETAILRDYYLHHNSTEVIADDYDIPEYLIWKVLNRFDHVDWTRHREQKMGFTIDPKHEGQEHGDYNIVARCLIELDQALTAYRSEPTVERAINAIRAKNNLDVQLTHWMDNHHQELFLNAHTKIQGGAG